MACLSNGTLKALMREMPPHMSHLDDTCEYDVPSRTYGIWQHWFGCEDAYAQFAGMVHAEAGRRNLRLIEACGRLPTLRPEGRWDKPMWVGWEPLHAEFRSYLHRLGEAEKLADRVCETCDVASDIFSNAAKRWLDRQTSMSHYHSLGSATIGELNRRLDDSGASDVGHENHYDQFGWDVRLWGGLRCNPPGPEMSYLAS